MPSRDEPRQDPLAPTRLAREAGAIGSRRFDAAVSDLLQRELHTLSALPREALTSLPWSSRRKILLAGQDCELSVFSHALDPESHLVALQLARNRCLGLVCHQWARGLVVDRHGAVREASLAELDSVCDA